MKVLINGTLLLAALLFILAYGAIGSLHRFDWVSWVFVIGPPATFLVWGWRESK